MLWTMTVIVQAVNNIVTRNTPKRSSGSVIQRQTQERAVKFHKCRLSRDVPSLDFWRELVHRKKCLNTIEDTCCGGTPSGMAVAQIPTCIQVA